jgi:hypothetical protein
MKAQQKLISVEKEAEDARQIREAAAATARLIARRPAVPLTAEVDGSKVRTTPTVEDHAVFWARYMDTCGTNSRGWTDLIAGQLMNAGNEGELANGGEALVAGFAFLNGLRPANEVEAALGAQMFAMHMMAMSMARRAEKLQMMDQIKQCAELTIKAARTFAAQAEALAKLRGGGKQTVEVRHVHINAQNAVIGDVHHPGGGGGPESANQPHTAALAHNPDDVVAAMWSEDPHRQPVQIADRPRAEAVPDARGSTRQRRALRTGQRSIPARDGDEGG